MLWIIGWAISVIVAPFVLFRFLGYCNRRHGLPENEVNISGEEAMAVLGVVVFAPVMVPFMLLIMFIQRINETEKQWVNNFLNWLEDLCNKVNSKRIKGGR